MKCRKYAVGIQVLSDSLATNIAPFRTVVRFHWSRLPLQAFPCPLRIHCAASHLCDCLESIHENLCDSCVIENNFALRITGQLN